ncbi:hypothetical protein [Marinicrinis sediminis]|uniref:DUF4825 domain-containing protein n=1 Tax=Marinicrinis sediminis TaxID=1652465 RepID=A0ABW5RCW1_9BACL
MSRSVRKSIAMLACLFLIGVLTTGCMYPDSQRKQPYRPSLESIAIVQIAVDQFQERTGVLPIKNSESDTPFYEKYIIDFKKLIGPYLSEPPSNAFENGGSDYYVLVDVEKDPTVKLMSLVAIQKVNDVQRAVDDYALSHPGEWPLLNPAHSQGWFTLDYGKLSVKEPDIPSFYSPQSLQLLIHEEQGHVVIDYASDLMAIIQKKGIETFEAEGDIRALLIEDHPYVPVKSFPYEWNDQQPVLLKER